MASLKRYITHSVSDGISFGHETYNTFLSFTIKFISHSLPSILVGHYLDQGVFYVQREAWLGSSPLSYMLLQISIWMFFFYGIFHILPLYTSEFQGSLTGIFFVTLFFVVQTNFIKNIQSVLGVLDAKIEKRL